MTMAESVPVLEMRGITKRYPGVVANDRIDLDLRPGEIHALLGENGAGKSTLMNILYGLAVPDEGEIRIDGQPVDILGPADAIARGISMVHQHFMLVPVLSVADNILLGEETMANRVFLDRNEAHRRIEALGRQFGFEIDPDAKIESLSVGWQQRVEILKALYRKARILVLDEPTAVLTPQETEEIFAVLRRLAAEGHSIIFISHKLYEVLEIADRITVIRRGRVVGQRIPAETDEDDLAELMVGREVQLTVDRGVSHPSNVVLEVRGLRAKDDRGREVVRGVDLEVRAGETLGIAGVAGNGQDELVEVLTGLRRPSAGRVSLLGRDVTGWRPTAAVRGRARVRAGRSLSLGDDRRLPARGQPGPDELLPFPVRQAGSCARTGRSTTGRRCSSSGSTSGPRRPRCRWTRCRAATSRRRSSPASSAASPKLLVLDQPTRGLDVGSIEFIHRRAIEMRDAGAAILLVSAELDEVLELSDRIAVMFRGELVATLDGRTANKEEVGLLMATGRRDQPATSEAGGPVR